MLKFFQNLQNRYAYYRWEKAFHIQKHLQAIDKAYADVNGFHLAYLDKKLKPDLSLSYGEIELESFLALLSMIKPRPHQVFYDLGSGLGKTVLAASLVYQFKKSYGIEILNRLVETAIQKHQKFYPQLNIEYIQDNFHNLLWADADILYINVASFVPETWLALTEKICQFPAPIMITCCKALPEAYFSIQKTQVQCSWGIVPAYIHQPKKARQNFNH